MNYQTLSDKQKVSLVKLTIWWKDELIKQGKEPEDDKRLLWMMRILTKQKYNVVEKNFLNQMREMRLGINQTKEKPQSKTFRSTVNINGFPMI